MSTPGDGTTMIGRRIGSYEIAAKLGEGGMGEVYRARDHKLDRNVAIKILPPSVAGDAAALGRFEREAKAVAALSHPNILAIHDFGRDGATVFAVMELLEGQTLRERLDAGPVPVRKTIEIALQIARGLAAAHAKGLIHRDLKPANVFLASNGHVKILDFGLAKALVVDAGASETVAGRPDDTSPGMVVGTVGYMSPEQIKGGHVDQRTDIFAFGSILYEMLTNRRAFARPSSAETIAAVLNDDVAEIPPALAVPPPLERIVRRCLEKNAEERFHSAHDLGIALEALTDRSASSAAAAPAVAGPRASMRTTMIVSAIAAAAVAALALTIWYGTRASVDPSPAPVRKFHILAPRLSSDRQQRPAVSPDGTKIVFAAGDTLWIQELDQLDPRQLATSWRPYAFFWSPDSAFVGFVSEEKLWKIAVSGGEPIQLARVPTTGGGALGVWRADGKIVFSTSAGGSGLLEVSQDGGEMQPIAGLQEGDVDFHEPALLPDDHGYVLVVHGAQGPDALVAIRGGTRKEILRLPKEQIVFPQYSATGHLVFGRAGRSTGIWAVPFDPARLEVTGEPFLVAAGALFPSLSREGTLTFFRRIWSEPRQLVLVTRAGTVERAIGEPQRGLAEPVLSPDGRRVAVGLGAAPQSDVWIYDIEQGRRTRLTFLEDPRAYPWAWTARNELIFSFTVRGRLRPAMASQPADGRGELQQLGEGHSMSVSRTGTLSVFANNNRSDDPNVDLYYRAPGDVEAKVFLSRSGSQQSPQLSPDGAYVAYDSNESGRYELYIRPFPSGAGQWQVSVNGGGFARWSPKGDKLWFRAYGNELMEVDVTSGATFAVSEPRPVFKGDPISVDLTLGYAVVGNGERFIAARRVPDPDGSTPSITVVQNWFAEFARRRTATP
jgi:Tol biopolymer transport system component